MREMKLLYLLVLVELATAFNLELGDRIIASQEECERIHKLNENWSTSNYHEEAVQYVDLYFICKDSLNEAKYAYIDANKVDLSWYTEENDKFPIFTSKGVEYVTIPPPRKPKDVKSMKKKLVRYLRKAGGKMNPLYRLMNIQSEMSQAIIDKQVECEVLALYILKHPDDKDADAKHTACMTKLNCIKERFMEQHDFTREQFPKLFPIMYKRRGTMVKTPPKFEKSVCETPDTPEGNKRELEKWMSGIEFIGDKLSDIGEVGTDFIGKLRKKGMVGGNELLTREELEDLMTDEQSGQDSDDDVDDDEADESAKDNGGVITKLAALKDKGVMIAQAQLEKAKPAMEQVENIASTTGERLKELEEAKLKPAIQKTARGLSNANLREKSKFAFEEFKGGLTTAENAAKTAKSKVEEDSSLLVDKMKSTSDEGRKDEGTGIPDEHEIDHKIASGPQGWLGTLINNMIHPEYLPKDHDGAEPPNLLKVLRDMGEHDEDGKEKISDDELEQMLKSLKESTKKRVHDLHLNKDQVKKSAEVVKGVMSALLYAARHGQGPAKSMDQQQINTAEPLVEELVDYAVAELIHDGGLGEDEEEEEGTYDKEDADVTPDGATKALVTPKTTTDQVASQDKNKTPTTNKEISQSATNAVEEDTTSDQEEADVTPDGTTTDQTTTQDDKETPVTNKEISQSATDAVEEDAASDKEEDVVIPNGTTTPKTTTDQVTIQNNGKTTATDQGPSQAATGAIEEVDSSESSSDSEDKADTVIPEKKQDVPDRK